MENNSQSGFSGQGNQGSQNNMGRNSGSADYNQSGSNQESAKFSQDNDDFSRSEDNMDNEMNLQTGFTGSDTSSTMYSGPSDDSTSWDDEYSDNEMSTSSLGRNDNMMGDADSDLDSGWNASGRSGSMGSGSQSSYSDGSSMDMDETRNASGMGEGSEGSSRSWNNGDAANGGFGQNNNR